MLAYPNWNSKEKVYAYIYLYQICIVQFFAGPFARYWETFTSEAPFCIRRASTRHGAHLPRYWRGQLSPQTFSISLWIPCIQYMVVFVGSIVRVASTSFRRTLHIQVTSEFHMCNIFSLGVDSGAQEDQYHVPLYIHCLLHFPHLLVTEEVVISSVRISEKGPTPNICDSLTYSYKKLGSELRERISLFLICSVLLCRPSDMGHRDMEGIHNVFPICQHLQPVVLFRIHYLNGTFIL